MESQDQVTSKPIRYCLYARKSSESDEKQSTSIESQVSEMTTLAQRDGLKIIEVYRESHSAKKCNQRPIFLKLMSDIENGRYNGIITWSTDRLSRNGGDLGQLVDLMDEGKLQSIITYSQRFSNNPNEKFLLMILGSQAKLENDNRGISVKRGIRNVCKQGLWPGQVPIGYKSKTAKGTRSIRLDLKRSKTIKEIFERVAEGQSVKSTIKWVYTHTSLRTKRGKHVSKSIIYKILRNKFYYGEFVINNKTYKGSYKPLITKELYQKVQDRLRPFRNTNKQSVDDHPLNRFISCEKCGSPMHRVSKTRKLRNGASRLHVYYRCCKQNDKNCDSKYIPEEKIIRKIADSIESIDISQIQFTEEIKDEIITFEQMRWGVYCKMTNSTIQPSISPLDFESIGEEVVKMYLRNMILYGNPEKRYYLIKLCVGSKLFTQLGP
jgi:DNA invertase Pin-like site-specific DNA recombinase